MFMIFRVELLTKKFLLLMLIVLLSFSMEKEKSNVKLAQLYFYRGYIQYTQGNHRDAIKEFSSAYLADRDGYYGELSYLYIGMSYAQLSFKAGQRRALYSAISYLNMYPYYYKKPNYALLQREFIGQVYLFAGLYERAKDIFFNLYRGTLKDDHLLNFLYADALSQGPNSQLLNNINLEALPEKRYLYHLIKGIYAFNYGNYKEAIEEFIEAERLNRYLEEDPEFLYRYAVSSFMLNDWRSAVFYFERLDRADTYRKYEDSLNFYLAFIYLMSNNYADAKKKVEKLINSGGIKSDLLISQLWLFPEFLDRYKKNFKEYKKTLEVVAWRYLNSSYSMPAILGIYYYALKEKKIDYGDVIRLKNLIYQEDMNFQDIKINMKPMLQSLQNLMKELDPYSNVADFLIEIYSINPHNYTLLFGNEKIARAITYLGKKDMKQVVLTLEDPLKSFLLGQLILLEGSEEGLNMIERSLKSLEEDDKKEALFILGIYKDPKLLEDLVDKELSNRLKPYLEHAYLRLGDFYYLKRDYIKAKGYYKNYLETSTNGDSEWITAYKLAKIGELTKDQDIINWVVKKAEKEDNIISKVIIALWGW
ncbi:MAG: hypothetical protein ACK4VK_05025 [Aquificaceae bacterium]